MYQVNLGEKILYYPGSSEAIIYNTELNEEIGVAGEFGFKVPPDNYIYSELTTGALVCIKKNGYEQWRGEIRDVKVDFSKIIDAYVLEDIAWLGDEYLPPVAITNESYAQRFQAAINIYNSTREPERQFEVGYISNVQSTDVCEWITEYGWSILDCLRNCICKDTGYLRVRREKVNGRTVRYIDIVKLSDYGEFAEQPIEYGYNLLDYVKDSDYGNLTNVLTPYGEEIDTVVYDDYRERIQGNVISNQDSISTYGRHAKAVIFEGVSNITELNSLAQSYLTRYSQPQITMEVKAVDMEVIEDSDAIKLGDSVRIIARPFAIDQRLYLTQIKRDIQNIDKNTITMSGNVQRKRTLTSHILENSDAIKNIPSRSSMLEAAKLNTLKLLNGAVGGHVIFKFDSNNRYVEEIIICNASTEAASTRKWVYNLNGWGYMRRDTVADEWEDLGVAATMDGEIIADFITAGTLRAIDIDGVNITGTSITGGTITGSVINSPSPEGQTGSVRISGGTLEVKDGTSGFLQLKKAGNESTYTALGGGNWACGRSGYYRELDARHIFDAGYAFQQASTTLTQTIDAYVWGPQGAQRADLIFKNGLLVGVNYK